MRGDGTASPRAFSRKPPTPPRPAPFETVTWVESVARGLQPVPWSSLRGVPGGLTSSIIYASNH